MHITDEELEYWGEVFVAHDYAKHMRFEQFIQNPERHHNRIQFYRSQGIDPAAVPEAVARLERDVALMARRNGHAFERLKHHRNR